MSAIACEAVLKKQGGRCRIAVEERAGGGEVVAAIVVAVGGVEIAIPFAHIEVERGTEFATDAVGMCVVVKSTVHAAVETRLTLFFEDDVDDAGRTFGRVFGGRVGDDFDGLDVFRWHLLQHLRAVFLVQSRGFAVDPNLDRRGVAEGDFSIGVHLDGRNALEHFGRVTAGSGYALVHREDFFVDFEAGL